MFRTFACNTAFAVLFEAPQTQTGATIRFGGSPHTGDTPDTALPLARRLFATVSRNSAPDLLRQTRMIGPESGCHRRSSPVIAGRQAVTAPGSIEAA